MASHAATKLVTYGRCSIGENSTIAVEVPTPEGAFVFKGRVEFADEGGILRLISGDSAGVEVLELKRVFPEERFRYVIP